MVKEETKPAKAPSQVKSTLILSRSGYRAGGKLVGTLLIEDIARSSVQSIDLMLVGYCRLDSRWHKASSYPFPPDHFHVGGEASRKYWALPKASNVFWTSEMTDLLPTPTYPEYVSQPPKDLLTPQPIQDAPEEEEKVTKMEVSRDLQRVLSTKDFVRGLMSFSFSVNLPTNLPPTIVATSCRYSYTVLHRIRFKDNPDTSLIWKECPFSVLTVDSGRQVGNEEQQGLAKCKSRISVVSHGDTILCTLRSTEIHDSSGLGQLTVHHNGPTMFRPVSLGSPRDCQSMRVSDPSGKPVTVLTVLGAAKLSPGSRLLLQFDFPDIEKVGKGTWAPCYQASACLQGEEVALQQESRGSLPKRHRARKHLLSTAHEVLDPACTERVCLTLLVPSDAPCSATTDILEISIWCVVDLTVGTSSSSNGHQNLRLEIPCVVGHPKSAFESQVDEDERVDDIVDESVDSFYSNDIRRDLKQLSHAVLKYYRDQEQPA